MRTPLSIAWLLAPLALLALASAVLAPALADDLTDGLLTNGGFEEWPNGQPAPDGWQVPEGRVELVSTPGLVAEGDRAAALIAESAGTRRARITQLVTDLPGGTYRFSGQVLVDDLNVDLVRLELAWTDALGQRDSQGTDPISNTGGDYQQLVTFPVLIPCGAANVSVSVLIQGEFGAASARAYVDDLRLKSVGTPVACPTPTTTPPSTTTPVSTSPPASTPAPTGVPTPSHGLLVNGGFEAEENGVPVAWQTHGGLLTQTSDTDPVLAGSFAGAFTSSTDSTKWAYQSLPVSPATWYQLDAFLYHDDPRVEAAFLRVAWYTTPDASGSALATIDSTSKLLEPQSDYRRLTTGPVLAPPGVHSAQVRILLRPRSATSALIYIDEVSFALVAPPTAEPTATPTATPTQSPTATRTPSPTATPFPTASPTPSHGLLVNGGFEADEDGRPLAWRTQGGVLLQVSAPVHSGRFAGGFASYTESTKWVYQTVTVTSNAWYQMDGYIYHDDPQVEAALLRISWYLSDDGSGSAVATTDSTSQLEERAARYRYLTTGPVQAPLGVRSAKVRILLRPRSNASGVIYIDDVSFSLAAPATPSPTPTPVITSTPTLTFSPSPTASPALLPALPAIRTPTPTSSPASTPAPTGVPTPSHGLLVNGGFETEDNGVPVAWQTQGGLLTQASAPVLSGSFAAALMSFTDSTKWAYQSVPVSSTTWYQLEAFLNHDDPRVEVVLLRIAWYTTPDASGSALATIDSTSKLLEPQSGYRHLTTGPVLAPPGVHSAQVRVLLRPRSATSALIYIDEVSFAPVAPPPVETDPNGSAIGERTDSTAGGPSDGPLISEVLGASQSGAAAAFTPMPTPVIRRSSRLAATESPPSTGTELLWWPWALAGGALVAGGVLWASQRWGRERREAPEESA